MDKSQIKSIKFLIYSDLFLLWILFVIFEFYFFGQFPLYCCSVAQSCLTLCNPWTAAGQAFLSFTISQSLLKLMSIGSMMLSNYLILCHRLLLLPSIFPTSRSFLMSQLLAIRWPNIGASASASVLPMNIQGKFPFGLTGLISLLSKGLSRVFSHTIVLRASILGHSAFFMVQLSHLYMTTGKNHSFDYRPLWAK